MDVMAKHRGDKRVRLLHVTSNWFGALHWGDSIHLTEETANGKSQVQRYRTVSDFLAEWNILLSKQVTIRVPFLRHKYGLGTVVGIVLAFFHIFPHGDCGCPDRKAWYNWLFAVTPWNYHGEEDDLGGA